MNDWIFHYQTENDVEAIRKSLIDLIYQCLESRAPIKKGEFERRIPRLLYGSYARRAEKSAKSSFGELIWKYSEITGKYCGCQFWSHKAKNLFAEKLESVSGTHPISFAHAKGVADSLAKKNLGDSRLVHEHVFPRGQLWELGSELSRLGSQDLAETVDRLAVGCVVTEAEHRLVNKIKGDPINPWLRYKGRIKLFENPNWSSSHPAHLRLIRDAQLL